MSTLQSFRTTDQDAIQRFLEHCHRKQYPSKSTIIRQGDPSHELFYIIKGSVTVMLEDEEGRELVLAYLNPGDFFGEIGLFNEHVNRSALVRAKTPCEVAQISYEKLKSMSTVFPDLLFAISSQLANRLRKMNRKIGDLAFMDVSRSCSAFAARSVQRTRRDDPSRWDADPHHPTRTRTHRRLLARDGWTSLKDPGRAAPN